MLAKRLGARQGHGVDQQSRYVDLVPGGEIDIATHPQQPTIGKLLTHVRRGDIGQRLPPCAAVAAEAMKRLAHGDFTLIQGGGVGHSARSNSAPQTTHFGHSAQRTKVLMPTIRQ